MTTPLPSHEELQSYCEASGAVPPLFLNMEAENIMKVLKGEGTHIVHEELMNRLARERRFPGYQESNEGIKMVHQDYVGVHQNRMHALANYLRTEYEQIDIGNFEEFLFMILYHDSPEGLSVIGYIPTPIKVGFKPSIKKTHLLYEVKLIRIIALQILNSEETGFSDVEMLKILEESDRNITLRSQLKSYKDKLDASMICLQEIRAGNNTFFLDKFLVWYRDFFGDVSQGIKLPEIKSFENSIPLSCKKLREIYDSQKISTLFTQIIDAPDNAARNTIIDNIEVYGIWKEANKILENKQA